MTEKEKKSIDKEQRIVVDSKADVIQKDNEMNDRINRLYGVSTDEPTRVSKEYSAEELASVRKKLMFLFVGVVIAGILIIVLLLSPLPFGKDNKNDKLNSNGDDVNENVNNENSSEDGLYIGEIELNEPIVLSLEEIVEFTTDDFKNIDLFPLYQKDVLEVKDIPNDIKLYMLIRNGGFYNLLKDNGVGTYVETCDSKGIVIDTNKIDQLSKNLFGQETTLEYKSINYRYYVSYGVSEKITLTYENNQYLAKCSDFKENNNLNKFVQQKTQKVIGTESAIEMYQYVVFINETGVYKDTDFKTLITNDKSAEMSEYIDKGNTYKYTFSKNENKYYLSKIELVK